MLAFGKRVGFAFLLAFVVLFGYQNLESLSQTARFQFNFYVRGLIFETPELPVVFLFVASFLLGMIAAGFHGFYVQVARHLDVRRRDRRIRELEQEVAALRAEGAQGGGVAPPATAEPPGPPETPVPQPGQPPPLEESPTL